MDVRCSRCGTEYDFDDALVSERGTTVKCTNCAHQFKVFPGGSGGAPERWIVRKASGRELVYTSLRDLQRAIAQRQVGPTDLLSRGGAQMLRPLGGIAELEPFFHAQGAAPAEAAQRTLLGVAPQGNTTRADSGGIVSGNSPSLPPTEKPVAFHRPAPAAVEARHAPPPKPRSEPPISTSFDDYEPVTAPRHAPVAPNGAEMPAFSPTRAAPVAQPALQYAEPIANDQMSAAFRNYQDSYGDESLPPVESGMKRSALRWVVGLVVAAGLAFVGGTIGTRYLKHLAPSSSAAAPVKDDRVRTFLDEGNAALDRSDFDTAKESFDKASALAEKDPTVLSSLARLQASKADQSWLSERLIDPTHKTELDAAKADLDASLVRVKKAADDATAGGSADPAVLRVRIDALRLQGDIPGARALVAQLGSDSSDPETAYVLGALDLAEPSPTWSTAIDRLRAAAAADRGLGRARAALVYALASSKAFDEARTELAKVPPSPPQAALAKRLQGFIDRLDSGAPAASGGPASSAPAVDTKGAPPAAAAAAVAASDGVPRTADFRLLLTQAASAKSHGDLARAAALYRSAQTEEPGNVEALAGLGDVARLQGNNATAAGYYDSVLQQNPSYLPTLMASADLKWNAGDHTGAVTLYKRVLNQTDPGSGYGLRAAARITEAQGAAAPSPAAPAAPTAAAPKTDSPAAPAPAPTSDNNIDTSDLPGFNK
jgi:predicted Zn finger-like uncharacterized protein